MTEANPPAGDERSPPRYVRIKRELVALLGSGKWRHGQAIPSEPLLARRFGASVGTIRRAVDELVAEHILVREQGRGTFVISHTRDYMLNVFFPLHEKDGSPRALPVPRLLGFARARADRLSVRHLALAPGAPVWRVQNLLTIGGRPAIHDDIRIPVALFPDLTERMLAERDTTLYGMFQQRWSVTVARTEELLDAVAAPAAIGASLGLPPGACVLRIIRTAYAERGVPVETRVRHVDTRGRWYRAELGRRA